MNRDLSSRSNLRYDIDGRPIRRTDEIIPRKWLVLLVCGIILSAMMLASRPYEPKLTFDRSNPQMAADGSIEYRPVSTLEDK